MNVMEPYSIISNSPSFSISYPSKHRKEFWRSSDKRGDAWQGWYKLAKDYYAAHGDLLIPRDYAVGSNNLGRWIERQRAAYNGKLACGITADHVLALNLIGMVWKLETRTPWDEWYCLAEAYYVENGHLCVPKDFVYKEKTLGAWIGEQRKRYKAGKLSQKQIDNLEKIGMLWQVGKERRSWEQSFQEAADYFAGHGNLKVPVAYRTERGTSLWQWVQSQREAYNGTRLGCLTADQIRRLTGIGMAWTVYDVAWEKMYAVAVRYYEQHGDLMVKQNYVAENGERLGAWIGRQRTAYKSGVMTIDRVVALNAIHMVWEIMKMPRWKQSFELAAEYFRQNGDLAVPLEYKAEGYALGKWLYRQRRLRNQGLLTKEQIQQLEAIGMDWRIAAKNDWSVWYAEAKQYYEAYGDLNVPPGYTAKDGKRLDVWVKSQRRIRNGRILGSLTENQIKALDRLGMNWTLKRRTLWERHFALAKAYSEKYGDLNIPQAYREADGAPLGAWLSKQRTEHNRGALSEEKTAMLQSIGIRWQPYEDRWEVMYAAAKIYYFLHGNINVPQDYIAPDGKHLGQWISVQRQVWNGAVRGALTENRIRQLDALGMRWYLDRNEEWNGRLRLAKKYKAQFGHCNIPQDYVTEDGFRLGGWLAHQRQQYKKGALEKDRIAALNKLGIVWSPAEVDEQKWQANFEDLKTYLQEHGGKFPPRVFTATTGISLYEWHHEQQRVLDGLRNMKMSDERKKKLASIGIVSQEK